MKANIDQIITADMISLGASLGTLSGHLPEICAIPAAIWWSIKVWDWYVEKRRKADDE